MSVYENDDKELQPPLDDVNKPSEKKQKSNSLESLIDIAEKETTEIIKLFKSKFFNENNEETPITSDALEKKIRNAIDIIRDTKVKSLEKNKDSEKENSLQIILSIFRHDIINKLAVLISSAHLLDMDNYEDKEYVRDEAQSKIKGMEMLIKEVDETEEAIASGELNLYNVRQVAEDIKNVYDNLKIKINDSHDKCLIKTNVSLCSILDNIVANAFRHGQATEIDITINKEDEKYVIIEVENNGSQLPDGIQEKIFEKGFKDEETGNTGLGLAMVRDSIKKDHGEVVAENTEKGVKFTIRLPLLQSK